MIQIEHLRKEYEKITPLKDVSVTINDGDIISVIGHSGNGKSTLLRLINLLEQPTSGKIIFDGIDITDKKCDISKVRQKIGMVFQNFNLFSHLTVVENIMLAPQHLLHKSKQEAYDNAIELLRMVDMESFALSYPDTLSGGQKQRVAIARTLAMDPEIILLDEPTSSLDPTMVGEVQAVISNLSKMGKTMMIVTHEMKFAREISNRVFYMDDGGVYDDGTPEEIFDNPKKERTRRFIHHLKIFKAEILSEDFDCLGIRSKIDQYGYKNEIPANLVSCIATVFEELCRVIILPVIEEKRILFTIEYDNIKGAAIITASYPGKPFNPMDSEDDISLIIVKGLAKEIKYEYSEDKDLSNIVTAEIF